MDTKYGNIPDITVIKSLKRLTGKVFKILPMREESCDTLDEYVLNLTRELVGTEGLVNDLKFNEELISLISTLHVLADNDVDIDVCRSDVFKSIDIIKKMIDYLEGGK